MRLSFPVGQGHEIQRLDEGISLLRANNEVTFFIPNEPGYGKEGSPPIIPPRAELVYYV